MSDTTFNTLLTKLYYKRKLVLRYNSGANCANQTRVYFDVEMYSRTKHLRFKNKQVVRLFRIKFNQVKFMRL